jgi:predicted kinase
MIIIVFGLPGSGKSYFASRLAETLKAIYINTDEERLKMFSARTYTDEEKMKVYNSILEKMKTAIQNKLNVVLDGTFYKESLRNKFEEAARKSNEKIIYMEVTADENTIKERLSKPRQYSEADYDVYLKLKASAEPLLKDHLVLVSSDDNIDSMIATATVYINTLR